MMKNENNYNQGMIDAAHLISNIYKMDENTRKILFGDKNLLTLFTNPQDILRYQAIYDNRAEIIRNHVDVGDILRCDEIDYVVTYVHPHNNFDLVAINSNAKGRVIQDTNFDLFCGIKTGEKTCMINLLGRNF